MDPSLRLAVELPPVPAPVPAVGPVSLEPWWRLALSSVQAGAGVVWFTGGPADRGPTDAGRGPADRRPTDARGLVADDGGGTGSVPAVTPMWCDACTIASAAVSHTDGALHGVVSSLPEDRHPSVLARDVTTLDIVSEGRAAVLLRWGTGGGSHQPHADLSAACGYLAEAIAVCRAVFQDDDPVFEGQYLHIAGAVNRPSPVRTGGPPLLVQAPPGAAALARDESVGSFFFHQAVESAAAIVCVADLDEIAAWRALVDEERTPSRADRVVGDAPKILCLSTLPDIAPAREHTGPAVPSCRSGPALRSHLEEARAAGADGVVLRIPGVRPGDAETGHPDPDDIARTGEELAGWFRPWQG